MSAQRDRVLRALENAGPAGICQVDFLAPNVVDGGKPITRLAARIMELREEGRLIVKNGTRHECAVYRLERATQEPDEIVIARFQEAEPVSLWQQPAAPANAIYGEDAA